MAQRVKMVEYAFDTRLTNLATNTTLGTATRHDFSAVTIHLPETSGSRVFRSVVVEISWRCATAVASNYSGWRIGVKLGAVAFDDLDYSPTAIANTGDHECSTITRNCTSYFTTNFGAASSQTMQVGFAMSQASANAVNNITAKVYITYEYDDSNTTHVKTVRIPIQGHHTSLTTSHVEIGTTGGTNNAAANQIPLLNTFLPETSKTIRRSWIEVYAQDGGTATTDFNAFYQIDAVAESTRATLEQAMATSTFFKDIFIYDTATHLPSAAHAFKARSSLTATFFGLSAVLYVTYEFDATASTTILNSLVLPLNEKHASARLPPLSTDPDVRLNELWVEEPGTITLVQSGVLVYFNTIFGGNLLLHGGSQVVRTYATSALNNSGPHAFVHRTDHDSGWLLSRGLNRLALKSYGTAQGQFYGCSIVNYTSNKATSGVGVHNRTTRWDLLQYSTAGAAVEAGVIVDVTTEVPNLPDAYFINAVGLEFHFRQPSARQAVIIALAATTGELISGLKGGVQIGVATTETEAELETGLLWLDCTPVWNRDSNKTGKLNIEQQRHISVYTGQDSFSWMAYWLTHHNITYTVSGTVSGYAGAGTGLRVGVYSTLSGTLEATATTGANGFFTATVFDNTIPYYVEVREDSTHVGRSDNGTPV